MLAMDSNSIPARIASSVKAAFRPALSTIRFLLLIMIPVSICVELMKALGVLDILALYLGPLMKLIGLSGEASLVFLSAALINNYSAIAVIHTLELSVRELSILAVLCLISHNLIVESAFMKRTGSSAIKMVILRIGVGLLAAWVLNQVLPSSLAGTSLFESTALIAPAALSWGNLAAFMLSRFGEACLLAAELAAIVSALIILQKLLDEFGVITALVRAMSPLMSIFGLPASASFLWIVTNFVGLSYGAGIMIERVESGKMSISDSDLLNHHVGISHSLIEDSVLYIALGVPALLAVLPRLFFALIVVWMERLRRVIFRRSLRVGTI